MPTPKQKQPTLSRGSWEDINSPERDWPMYGLLLSLGITAIGILTNDLKQKCGLWWLSNIPYITLG